MMRLLNNKISTDMGSTHLVVSSLQNTPHVQQKKDETIMDTILKNAPTCSVIENNESIRFDSLSNLIDDVKHEIYIIEEEELIEDAKETLDLVKKSNVRPHTLKQYKDAYDNIKREYKELKDYLKYLKGGK